MSEGSNAGPPCQPATKPTASLAIAAPEVAPVQPQDARRAIDTWAVGALLLCCAIWGLNQVIAKLSVAELPPLTLAAWRSAGAAMLVAVWAAVRGVRLWARDGTLVPGFWAAAFFAAEFACIFVGLQYTSASRMAVFIYLAPLVVAIGMPFVASGERLGATGWFGLLLAFAAVAWAFAEGLAQPSVGPRQWLGDALGLAAAILWAMTTLVIRGTRLTHAAPELTLFYQLGGSALMLAALSWLAGESWALPQSASTWGLIGFQTLIVCFASYLLWFWLVRHYPATKLSVWLLLTPVFGLLFGVVLLGEPLTVRLVIALVAVCAGVVLVSVTKAR